MYPMGNKVTIRSMKTEEQIFLTGHRNIVSTLCVSPRGDLIASGQVSHQGFKVGYLSRLAIPRARCFIEIIEPLFPRRRWS